jgi:hypothetical protein
MSLTVSPRNGEVPENISYKTTPKLKISDRWSIDNPKKFKNGYFQLNRINSLKMLKITFSDYLFKSKSGFELSLI